MYLVLLFAAAALLGDSCHTANVHKHMRLLADMDNHIENSAVSSKQNKKFVAITQRPSAIYSHEAGTTLSLTCITLGSPAPSVHWFKNDAPVYEFDQESMEVIDSNPTSLGELSSTLLVTRSSERDTYTCLAVAGSKTARATTTVYGTGETSTLSERTKLSPLEPHIIVSYNVFVDVIGSTVVLPCKVRGHPRPVVTWTDNKGLTIKDDARMKVLRTGELAVSSLRWGDMGAFTCRAANAFGTHSRATFLYPAKAG